MKLSTGLFLGAALMLRSCTEGEASNNQTLEKLRIHGPVRQEYLNNRERVSCILKLLSDQKVSPAGFITQVYNDFENIQKKLINPYGSAEAFNAMISGSIRYNIKQLDYQLEVEDPDFLVKVDYCSKREIKDLIY